MTDDERREPGTYTYDADGVVIGGEDRSLVIARYTNLEPNESGEESATEYLLYFLEDDGSMVLLGQLFGASEFEATLEFFASRSDQIFASSPEEVVAIHKNMKEEDDD